MAKFKFKAERLGLVTEEITFNIEAESHKEAVLKAKKIEENYWMDIPERMVESRFIETDSRYIDFLDYKKANLLNKNLLSIEDLDGNPMWYYDSEGNLED